MKLTSISKTIYLSEFPTDVLITELYNRIYDDMHDEEPRYDPLLNDIPTVDKTKVLTAIGSLKNE
jgi:hypothetical protein